MVYVHYTSGARSEYEDIESILDKENVIYIRNMCPGAKAFPDMDTDFPNLRELVIVGNELKSYGKLPDSIKIFSFIRVDNPDFNIVPKGITELWITGCVVNKLDLDFPELTMLYCDRNKVKEIERLPKSLEKLIIYDNLLSTFKGLDLPNLKLLNCRLNPLQDTEEELKKQFPSLDMLLL